MPQLRTDDGPRKLRAVWLGPAGATLPFQWTYVQWAVTLCAIPLGITLFWVVLSAMGVPLGWVWPIAIPWGGTAAVYLAVRVMSHVTFDEPLRYHNRLVRGEWSSKHSRRVHDEPVQVWWQVPEIGFLAPTALRAMGWLNQDQLPLPGHPADRDDERRQAQADDGPRHNPYLRQPPGTGSAGPTKDAEETEPVADLSPTSTRTPEPNPASVEVTQAAPWWRQRSPAER